MSSYIIMFLNEMIYKHRFYTFVLVNENCAVL